MIAGKQKTKPLLMKLWALGCSLKLAIALATVATLFIMGGSLVMHFNPQVFASMEQEVMSRWLPKAWRQAPLLVAWVPLSGLCVILFGINTLCCLIDWLFKIKVRWRKAGEYLIHAGFILLLIAYLWGSLCGFRSGPHQIFPGERVSIANIPGYALQLNAFTPQLEPSGRPLDMINQVSLWKDEQLVAKTEIRINHPLIHDGLVILPTSFGQVFEGIRFQMLGRGFVNLVSGSRLPVEPGLTLVIDRLLPDARQVGRGQVISVGDQLNNPAMQISLWKANEQLWQGWYFLRAPLPERLRLAGISLHPVEPLYKTFSLLTINRDPGDKLAMAGGLCIAIGVICAFFSFYWKRARGDHPEF